jgi:hypothetical protein
MFIIFILLDFQKLKYWENWKETRIEETKSSVSIVIIKEGVKD